MKVGSVDKLAMLPTLDAFLSTIDREKPLNSRQVADMLAIITPDMPSNQAVKFTGNLFWLLIHLIYDKKYSVNIPYLGLYEVFFKQPILRISRVTGDEKASAGRWVFKFRPRLKQSTYRRDVDKHIADAEKYGYTHMNTNYRYYQEFLKEYRILNNIPDTEWIEYDDVLPEWNAYIAKIYAPLQKKLQEERRLKEAIAHANINSV